MRCFCVGLAAALGAAGVSSAATVFHATLDGSQEVPANGSTASGTAVFTLNDTQTRLEMSITLQGLDLDGSQSPGDDDNVTGAHIHAAPAGLNGAVVFGLIGVNNDLNGDLMIDANAGTITSGWDLNEGQGTTLGAQLANLFNDGLYINIHTEGFLGGEIRGQIVPAPGAAPLLGIAGLAAVRRRR